MDEQQIITVREGIPMKRLLTIVFATLTGFGILAGFSANAQFEQELDALQRDWARVNLAEPAPAKTDALKALAHRAGKIAQRYPNKMQPRVWEAVILNSYAQATGRYHRDETVPEIVERLRAEDAGRGDTRS
jgi:hypothetical protein